METHYKTNNGHQRALVPWFLKMKKKKNAEMVDPHTSIVEL